MQPMIKSQAGAQVMWLLIMNHKPKLARVLSTAALCAGQVIFNVQFTVLNHHDR